MKVNNFQPIKEVKEAEDHEIINKKFKENNNNKEKDETNEKIEKEKQIQLQQEIEKAELNSIIKLLKLEKDKRIKADIIKIKEYLCTHIDYFKNLLEQSEEKLLKLIPSLNYEVFKTNERIMNFGEEGDKCYILLKGKVGIYKPFPITKQMTLREYVEYLVHIRDIEKDMQKFDRILNYNSKIDKFKLISLDFDYTKIPRSSQPLSIMLEEERELGQGKPGSSFGEMALIKNEPRNASIIALERCSMISIEKNSYTKIVKDIEEQRINKELSTFKQSYPIVRYWPPSKCFRLLSGFITEEFDREEYVFKQNDVPKAIYLIKDGIFEVFSNFNFSWYEKFVDYIHDTSFSLLNDIDNPMLWKEDKIIKKINDAYKENNCPFLLNKKIIDKEIISNQGENNDKNDITKDIEGEINQNLNQIYKAKIQTLESPNIFGFLEVFELKFRVCNVKCVSQKGTLMKFPLLEFLQLIPTDKRNQFYLQQRIFNEKKNIISQIKNCILAKLNFIKNEEKKNIYISKDFFLNNNINKNTNQFDFRRQYIDHSLTPLRNIKIIRDINPIPKLNKSKSSLYHNIQKINKKMLLSILSKDYINSEDYIENDNFTNNNNDNSFENRKHNSKNGIILGFKNSIIKLNKDRLRIIKGLFPKEMEKKTISPTLNIKQINNSDKEYIKFLEKNIELNKTPTKLIKMNINGTSGMTGKKYTSLETAKFIYKLNAYNNKTKSTNESKRNSEIILPNINSGKIPIIINKNTSNSKIKFLNYKVEEKK